jgi:hypothetical protein
VGCDRNADCAVAEIAYCFLHARGADGKTIGKTSNRVLSVYICRAYEPRCGNEFSGSTLATNE